MTKSKPKKVKHTMCIPEQFTLSRVGKSTFTSEASFGIEAILHSPMRITKIIFKDKIMTIEGYEDD